MRDVTERKRLYWIGALAAIAGLASLVCSPPEGTYDTRGEEGNLKLKYLEDGEPISSFGAPGLAAEAFFDVEVHTLTDDSGEDLGEVAEVSKVTFASESAMDAEINQPDRLQLFSYEPTEVSMEVEIVTDSGDAISDRFSFSTKEVDGLELTDACKDIPNQEGQVHALGNYRATYLTDSYVHVDYQLRSGSRALLGYGLFPFDVVGDAELIIDEEFVDGDHFHFWTGSQAGESTVESTVDLTRMDVRLVEPAEIDAVTLSERDELASLSPDQTWEGYIVPEVEGRPVCYSDIDRVVESLTPSVCSVEAPGDDADTLQPWVRTHITREDEGVCQIEVDFPMANGGDGLLTELHIDEGMVEFVDAGLR